MPPTLLTALMVTLGLKLLSIVVSFVAMSTRFDWVPPASTVTLLVALAFVGSSAVLLVLVPRLGLASCAAYGALTFYGAVTSIFTGQYLAWSLFAGLTGLALVGLAIAAWPATSSAAPLPNGATGGH